MRSFTIGLTWRILLLTAVIGGIWHFGFNENWAGMIAFLALGMYLGFNMHHYVTDSNRKFTRFLESVRYSDFAVRYAAQAQKGDTFGELNRQFNEVLEAFRQARAEKEANLQFLHTIVQHLATGVLAFDHNGQLLLSNTAAFQLLDVYRLKTLDDLPESHQELALLIKNLKSKGKLLYQPDASRQLSVQGTVLLLRGKQMKLVTIQNILPELQRKEVDAWQNLTRVLRHEIMNSITPISSLIGTMQEIIKSDFTADNQNKAALADLEEALQIIASRSQGLMDFVNAYRAFSSIPKPKIAEFYVGKMFEKVVHLFQTNLKATGITVEVRAQPENLVATGDPDQIEMILINLIKNAIEALQNSAQQPRLLRISAGMGAQGKVQMEVEDNGPGIDPQLLEEIFIPFFTTKETGTGVGLSLSKQIIQHHNGNIRVRSTPGEGARFVLEF